jgi:hypothetical protein
MNLTNLQKILKAEARAERKAKATKRSEIKKYSQRVHPYQHQNCETFKAVRPGRCFNCGEREAIFFFCDCDVVFTNALRLQLVFGLLQFT